MDKAPLPIRVSVVLIKDTRILVVRHNENDEPFWALPGGWTKPGEELTETVVRALREETGFEIEVLGLLHADEAIYEDRTTHCLQLIYSANIVGEAVHPNPEGKFVRAEYVELERLTEDNFMSYIIATEMLKVIQY
ncbi:MAG: NUDIX domain-containing protein [Candidatus Bathyarchaeota archaeon]|nr:NUDIX domain-containing protein [Candidatus Bathyarchaeota archaeon]